MSLELRNFSTRVTPQNEPIPGSSQVENSAGGFSWKVSAGQQLRRFLILGTGNGTYYINEKELTRQNAQVVIDLLNGGQEEFVLSVIEDVSVHGLAPKNDQALFALALACSIGRAHWRRQAFELLPRIARTGSHLLQFVGYLEQFRGWGKQARRGIANWYASKSISNLAHQLTKYRNRNGWSHHDVLHMCHDNTHPELYQYVKDGGISHITDLNLRQFLTDVEIARTTTNVQEAIRSIERSGLTWEMVNTEVLGDPRVWGTLLAEMPYTAMIRNLGRMTANGLLIPFSQAAEDVVKRILDIDAIRRSRIHPLNILIAAYTYASGGGYRGSLRWNPVSSIMGALNHAFYLAFENVLPTHKKYLIGLDVSGSMGVEVATNLTARDASAAMAMSLVRTEASVETVAFTGGVTPFPLLPTDELSSVVDRMFRLPLGSTDCALPMLYALEKGIEVDTFVIFTDSETWYGYPHPAQALQQYRDRTGIPARLIVVAMVANRYSIADPDDAGMLDLVGFDASLPRLIQEFSEGEI